MNSKATKAFLFAILIVLATAAGARDPAEHADARLQQIENCPHSLVISAEELIGIS